MQSYRHNPLRSPLGKEKEKMKRISNFEKLLPSLGGKPMDINMRKVIEDSHREFMQMMDEDRKEMRRRRVNDPNVCHCPSCYIVG
jgi:hypothetical protein